MKRDAFRRGVLAAAILLLVSLLWFAPVVLGGKTLIPAENLYQFQPWQSLATQAGVGDPQNELVNDLLLENFVWKSFLRQAIDQGELPLWNPNLFTGLPFLAAGQHSALYPLSLIFYLLPLPMAYGVFTWLQLAIAGFGMLLLARSLRLGWAASLFAGFAYAFSSFFVVSVVFTMIIAAAAWLPWILAAVEMIIRKQEEKGDADYSPVPYVIAGAAALGIQVLAGHPEISVLVLLTTAFYALWRLILLWRRIGSIRRPLHLAVWLLVMVLAGLAIGSIQLIPLLELVTSSFREGSVSYDQVVGWAWPVRQVITFLLPDFFGNPSHHGWFDPGLHLYREAGPNAFGEPVRDVFWGVKNYVEGGNYLGIMTLLLALVAVGGALASAIRGVSSRNQPTGSTASQEVAPPDSSLPGGDTRHIWLFAALALLSLAFAFGTPLYALLFYGVPGYKQLHSAFRWVFPYTLAMSALAGYGMQMLLDRLAGAGESGTRIARLGRVLGFASMAVGIFALLAVLASLIRPEPFAAIGQRIVDWSDLAQRVFAGGEDFWGYQWGNLLHFGVFSTLAGLWLIFATRSVASTGRNLRRWLAPAAMAILMVDLFLVLGGFNPASDPELLERTPPSVAFLQQDDDLWRLSSFEGEGTSKTFNANTPWMSGLQDIRGYDSIISKQYVDYMESIEPQGQLLYNRISPFYDPASLDDPLTDLLGVKYIMTELPLELPAESGWAVVYDDEVRILENRDVFPRAFVAAGVELAQADDVLRAMRGVDLREVVVLEEAPPVPVPATGAPLLASGFSRPPADYDGRMPAGELPAPASPQLRTATVSRYGTREVFVDLNLDDRGWLVLTDAWFPGWKAFLRPFGVVGEGVDAEGNPLETELPIFRADGNFRAVYLPQAGQWTVRFVYSPRSVQLGIYVTFLALVSLLLLGGAWAWGRFYRETEDEHSEVRRVAKNSTVLMALSLLNRAIDFVFAMLRLRVLGPAGEGSYAFTIAIYGFFEILVRFGLGTLLTRDVAQEKDQAGRYLVNVLTLRLGLWVLALPLVGLVMAIYAASGSLTTQEAQAIGLFTIALFFATLSDSFTAVFTAYEKMEYPAAIASAMTVAKVGLGALVLLPPFSWGFVGLAGVSVVTNIIQSIWLGIALRRHVPMHYSRADFAVQRVMLRESYPLMLNHLLASVFWRIDLWILRPLAGAASVGIYSAAVKYLDGINVIPSYFTLAIFPLMSRYAKDSHESLVRAYQLAIRLLVMIALPIAVVVTVLATPLIRILGGAAYLPDSAIALRILIWSIPVGFVNSVTQYVLIAVGQQRFLTKAFFVGVAFNTSLNLLLIPRYGYQAAAVVTIFSEFSLLIPFYLAVRRHVATLPWVDLIWRQVVAAVVMGGVAFVLMDRSPWVAAGAGTVVYVLVLLALGTFRDPDMARVWQAFPGRRRATAIDTGEGE
ncbi:MAG: oligosaccharide flippase family protein [Chloroflexota bacterium]|nr:oligosaccharide flippase family protein [Chloroflexota bacterium]